MVSWQPQGLSRASYGLRAALRLYLLCWLGEWRAGIKTLKRNCATPGLLWRQIYLDDTKWEQVLSAFFSACGLYIGFPLFRWYVRDSEIPAIKTLATFWPPVVWGIVLVVGSVLVILGLVSGIERIKILAGKYNAAVWCCISVILIFTQTPGLATWIVVGVCVNEYRRMKKLAQRWEIVSGRFWDGVDRRRRPRLNS
jgi:hypothetical protein